MTFKIKRKKKRADTFDDFEFQDLIVSKKKKKGKKK